MKTNRPRVNVLARITGSEANAGFLCRLVLGTGLGLAIPASLLCLVSMGTLNRQKLTRLRPFLIVVNLILGAAMTTPDVATQVLMFVPLQLLCEIITCMAGIIEKRARRHA